MLPTHAAGAPHGVRRLLAGGMWLWLASGLALPGCYAPQLGLLRTGLDSLRAVVDTLSVRDSVTLEVLQATRRELAEQRDILLSTRASTGTTSQEVSEQMNRLGGKLDEVMGRFQQISQRTSSPTPVGGGMNQLYDEAAGDLTQGRYSSALRGFREFVSRYPSTELSDNAQYGVGECFFAQAMFDSAEVEYARVESMFPNGDKVPASLYKLALSRDRQGKTAAAKKTFEDLVKRFPNSGEAQLARERLGGSQKH